jgi:hypothetical protein
MTEYLAIIGKPFLDFYLKNEEWFNTARHPHHPGKQKEVGGMKLHTIQVIKKALELNQEFPEKEIIECCLVHDIKGCEKLPLTERQRIAIETTKGLSYSEWRKKPDYRFTVLILIADMWSAFINIKNL